MTERQGPELGPGGVRSLIVLGLLAAFKAIALVGLAEALARGITLAVGGAGDLSAIVALGAASALVRAAVSWANQAWATRASAGAKEELRRGLLSRLMAGPLPRALSSTGSARATGTVGLDALDSYYRQVLPALVTAATVPLLIGARILLADWLSALIIVLTIPLVPIFMVLIGQHTAGQAERASAGLRRLSDHLVELARGLPVLVGLGRVDEQSRALEQLSDQHRRATMRTLKTAFLSALVMELIATISVAVVAVTIGIRLVHGDLDLSTGLLVLILAPECYAPLRDVGTAFHSAQDGLAALRRTREITEAPLPAAAGGTTRASTASAIRLDDITIHYDDRTDAVIAGLNAIIPHGGITAIEGRSGSGKSSLLTVLAGAAPPSSGTVSGVDPLLIAWVPQHPHTVGDTVLEELQLYAGAADPWPVMHRLGLGPLSGAHPAQLSPGELRRLAVARGIVRVEDGATLLILDEPTAHLDAANARLVQHEIARLAGTVTVVLASHEQGIARLATQRIVVGALGGQRDEAEPAPAAEAVATGVDEGLAGGGRASLSVLRRLLRPVRWSVLGGVLLGAAASSFAIALTALSGWLIVRASEEPNMMYLMVAIVGVRFFGIGRAVLRYAERLVTHDWVLRSTTTLRLSLWAGLSRIGLARRRLMTGTTALDYLIIQANRARDLIPRVLVPPVIAVATALVTVTGVALLHSPAVPLLLGGLLFGLVVAPLAALAADARATAALGPARSEVARRFATAVDASDELRVNAVAGRVADELHAVDVAASRHEIRGSTALGVGAALAVLAGTGTAVLMLLISVPAVAAGSIAPAIAAVLVLVPLGLIDPMLGLVDAVQQWPSLRATLARLEPVMAVPSRSEGRPGIRRDDAGAQDLDSLSAITALRLDGLRAGWPETVSAMPALTADAVRGDWIVLSGPSGIGKSTVLATLLGFLAPAEGRWSLNGRDARTIPVDQLRSRIAWCPQEAHLFDSTIRGNLLLARSHADAPSDAEMHRALALVQLDQLLASLPEGLDSRVGAAGNQLSGGEAQRLALARTILTRADVVLLDEPTAHLDARTAQDVMTGLRTAFADRIVVLVSHHDDESRAGDIALDLSPGHRELAEV